MVQRNPEHKIKVELPKLEFSPETKRILKELNKTFSNLKINTDKLKEVNKAFDSMKPNPEALKKAREIAFDSNKVNVIAPECFITADENVISYKGVNYYRVPSE